MSDNPADSLRRELEAENETWEENRPSDYAPVFVVSVVDAARFAASAAEAARADERERIAKCIEATRVSYSNDFARYYAALVRGLAVSDGN